MKILYLHQYFNTPAMAGGTRSFEMAKRLVARGHTVEMITSDRAGQFRGTKEWHETEEAGIVVHWTPVFYSNRMGFTNRILAFFRFAIRAARKAASIPCDVVFASSTPLTIAVPAVYGAKRQHVPMVFEVRDFWPDVPIAMGVLMNPFLIRASRWLEAYAYRNSTRIVALSPGMRDGIIGRGYPARKVSVIPNGCDLEFFDVPPERGEAFRRTFEWLQDRPLVLYAGALGRANGVSYLVRVASEVRRLDPEIRFLVIGDGKEKEPIEGLARGLGVLGENFFMMDSLPKHEMPGIFSAATIVTSLFIPVKALWANSANKFFDGLAAGRPLAINYGSWQAELLEEVDAGIQLDPNDIETAAHALNSALQDKQWLAAAGSRARYLAEHAFSRDRQAQQLEEVLKESIKV